MVSVKKIFTLSILTLFLLLISEPAKADEAVSAETAPESNVGKVPINYVDEDILDIINDLSEKKKVNVVVPTGANALKIKVNFKLPYKETVDKAWDLLKTYLDMAGYSLLPKGDMFIIVKNSKDVFDAKHARQPTRMFIDVKPTDLPSTDERITYLYYFSNLKINATGDSRIGVIAGEILPEQSFYKLDSATNSILVTAKSFDVKAFMELVTHLDHTEYKEHLEFIRLRYTTAKDVADMFNNDILKAGTPKTSLARYRTDIKKPVEDSYFPESIKIIDYPQHNSLVVMGRSQAIDRVRKFVYKYIDVELESGQSILGQV